ncbi:MAG: class I SAM-dependent methyltransferase [Cyclobacteriaceae bacterium]
MLLSFTDLSKSTVLDIGCGCGDLLPLIREKFTKVRYVGIDQQIQFIEIARERYENQADAQFVIADIANCILPKADHVLASGVFNYKSSDLGYYHEMISKFYRVAQKSLVFNMLNSAVCKPTSLLTAHNPSEISNFCRTLSRDVTTITDYLSDDFTICMKH